MAHISGSPIGERVDNSTMPHMPKVLSWVYVAIALIGTLATALLSFGLTVLGRGNPSLVAGGVAATTLFVFLLTLHVSHGKAESKDEFLKKGAFRTAIAASFTVAYLMLLAFSTAPQTGLSLDAKILDNFNIVYIFTIGLYFGTVSLERVVDIVKGKQSSLFSS